jgi:hypothetical protein
LYAQIMTTEESVLLILDRLGQRFSG